MTEYVGAADAGLGLARVVRRDMPSASRRTIRMARARRGGRAAWRAWYIRRAMAIDLSLAIAAVAFLLLTETSPVRWGVWEIVGLIPLWLLLLSANKGYAGRHLGEGSEEYRAIGRAGMHLYAVFAAWFLLVGLQPRFSSLIPLLIGLPLGSAIGRKVLRTSYFHKRVEGKNLQRVVVVGPAAAAHDLVETIVQNPVATGLRAVAVCTDQSVGSPHRLNFRGVPIHGNPQSALQAAERYQAEVVAISSHPDLVGHSLRRLSWALEARGIDLMVDPGIVEVAGPRLSLRPVAGMSMLHVERPVANWTAYRTKFAIERVVALLAVLMLLPMFLAIAVAIKRDSRGPVFYSQWRTGAGGTRFRMLKFRSMIVDADAQRDRLVGLQGGSGKLFKMRRDPRVTKVGTWLRRYSLDELPQLVNVVRGEMSLVGPRPALEREVDAYELDAHRRLRRRPGMTGLWQVSGRSNLSWEESLRLDLWYVDNWSVTVDLQILVRTVRAVVQGRGAY